MSDSSDTDGWNQGLRGFAARLAGAPATPA